MSWRNIAAHTKVWGVIAAVVLNIGSLLSPGAVQAGATLYFSPTGKTLQMGETWTVAVLINADQPVNGVKFTVAYPAHLISALDVACGSDFSTAIQPSIANGSASINCARIGPFSGTGGRVGSVTFKAAGEGSGSLTFGVSNVTAHDGKGTNVYTGGGSASVTVASSAPAATPPPTNNAPAQPNKPQQTAPVATQPAPTRVAATASPSITSPSHPDQERWYTGRTVEASWNGGYKGYNFAIDQLAATQLGETVKSNTATSMSEVVTGDGVWYVHVRAMGDKGWSNTSHYKVQIDSTAPSNVVLKTKPESPMSVVPAFEFSAEDGGSGIEKFELNLDGGEWVVVESGFKPQRMESGEHTAGIRVTDRAGNKVEKQTKFTIMPLATPKLTSPQGGLLMLGERVKVSGTAPLNTEVEIYLNKEKKEVVKVDAEGKFISSEEYLLFPGQYSIAVKAINADGITSPMSTAVQLTIDAKAVSVMGLVLPGWGVFGSFGLVIVGLLLGLLWLAYRLWRQTAGWRGRLQGVETQVDSNLESLEQKLAERIDAQLASVNPEAAASLKAELAAQIDVAGDDVDKALAEIHEVEMTVSAKVASGFLTEMKIKAVAVWAVVLAKVGLLGVLLKTLMAKLKKAKEAKKTATVEAVKPEAAPVTSDDAQPEGSIEAQKATISDDEPLSAEAKASLEALEKMAGGAEVGSAPVEAVHGAIPEIGDILTPEVETSEVVKMPEVEGEEVAVKAEPVQVHRPAPKEVVIPANALAAIEEVEKGGK
jgi:hypothetical protein